MRVPLTLAAVALGVLLGIVAYFQLIGGETKQSAPDAASEAPVDVPAKPGVLEIASAAGVPLERVELLRDGAWEPVATTGSLDLAGLPLPLDVRAPGHVAARLEAGAERLALEPDVLFVLEGPDLRERVALDEPPDPLKSILRMFSSEAAPDPIDVASILSFGFVDGERFAAAFDAAAWEAHALGMASLAFTLPGGERLGVHVRTEAGARATLALPPDVLAPDASPLTVRVRGATRPPGQRVQLGARADVDPDAPVVNHAEEWGSWTILPPALLVRAGDEGALAVGEAIELGRFPAGRRLRVDAVWGRTGRSFRVEHDARPRALLVCDHAVGGRLVVGDGGAPPPWARVVWLEAGGDEVGSETFVPDADGSAFRLERAHAELLAQEGDAAARPFSLRVEAPGFERRVVEYEAAPGAVVELGDVALAPAPPDLVLAPGHRVRADAGLDLVLPHAVHRVPLAVEAARELSDGGLGLHLFPAEFGAGGERLFRRLPAGTFQVEPAPLDGWPEIDGFVLADDGRFLGAFELLGAGDYARVPERTYAVQLVVGAFPEAGEGSGDGVGALHVGWAFGDYVKWERRVDRTESGTTQLLSFDAPERDVELWWGTTIEPILEDGTRTWRDGGSRRIAPGGARVELP